MGDDAAGSSPETPTPWGKTLLTIIFPTGRLALTPVFPTVPMVKGDAAAPPGPRGWTVAAQTGEELRAGERIVCGATDGEGMAVEEGTVARGAIAVVIGKFSCRTEAAGDVESPPFLSEQK